MNSSAEKKWNWPKTENARYLFVGVSSPSDRAQVKQPTHTHTHIQPKAFWIDVTLTNAPTHQQGIPRINYCDNHQRPLTTKLIFGNVILGDALNPAIIQRDELERSQAKKGANKLICEFEQRLAKKNERKTRQSWKIEDWGGDVH